jgi:hypothetical protein
LWHASAAKRRKFLAGRKGLTLSTPAKNFAKKMAGQDVPSFLETQQAEMGGMPEFALRVAAA